MQLGVLLTCAFGLFFFFNGKICVYTHIEREYLPMGYVEGLGEKKETKITRIEKKSPPDAVDIIWAV